MLMNVLSGQYDKKLVITGQIYHNGHLTTHSHRLSDRSIGYVEQNVLFMETMTLEEHLIFQVPELLFTYIRQTNPDEYLLNCAFFCKQYVVFIAGHASYARRID